MNEKPQSAAGEDPATATDAALMGSREYRELVRRAFVRRCRRQAAAGRAVQVRLDRVLAAGGLRRAPMRLLDRAKRAIDIRDGRR